jgi:drug/metabolite transporter (DMT)-like permease
MTSSSGNAARGRPLLLAAFGAASISASAVLVTLAGASAPATAFFRCALALPALGVLAVVEQRRLGGRPVAERVRAAVAGVFLGIDLLLWTHAIRDVGAGVATVLGNLQVLFVGGIAWLLYRERPHRAILLALPVVMTGVVLVSGLTDAARPGLHPVAGIGYGLGTSVAYAAFLLILRRSSTGRAHVAGPVFDATAGAAATALLAGLRALGQVPFYPPSVGGWPGGVAWLSTAATQARIEVARRAAAAADLADVSAAAQRDRPDAVARLLGVDAWTARTRRVLADAAADPVRLVTLAVVAPEYVVC